jgi:two-component system LytT family response regulator
MTALRIMIVDDESHARERLQRLLAAMDEVEVVGECANGEQAVADNARLRPDLMLLDVQMPAMNGFGVIRNIPTGELPLIVFVTAFDGYAIEAFDVHAVDYILKPVESPRLWEAIERARTRLEHESLARHQRAVADVAARTDLEPARLHDDESTSPAPTGVAPDRFLLRDGGKLHPVKADEILWIEAHGNYARLNLPDGKTYTVRSTMGALEARLDGSRFARVHRSAIVNLDAVQELQPWFGGDYVVILKNGARLRASRSYKARLEKWILG